VTLGGICTTQTQLDDLRQLFRHVKAGTVHTLFAGKEVFDDLTSAWELVKECAFDAEGPYDGWYLLTGFSYSQGVTLFPYTANLWYIETEDFVKENVGTGDGATKVFSVDETPVMYGTVSVYVNDVLQGAATYTLDYEAGTVTFDTAPGNGLSVAVSYTHIIE